MSLTNFPLRLQFRTPATVVVVLIVVVTCLSLIEPALTQQQPSTQEAQQPIELVPPGQEKRLYVMVRKEIPLKFKVKNENSKRWAHDLEIEVTNTSGKPIYFFHFVVTLPDIKGDTGITIGFWKHYGRAKLIDYSTPLEADDVPLLPDEKYTFKLSEGEATGWDFMKQKQGKPEPRRIVIEFVALRFGDGTGYNDSKFIDTRRKSL